IVIVPARAGSAGRPAENAGSMPRCAHTPPILLVCNYGVRFMAAILQDVRLLVALLLMSLLGVGPATDPIAAETTASPDAMQLAQAEQQSPEPKPADAKPAPSGQQEPRTPATPPDADRQDAPSQDAGPQDAGP